MAQINITDLQPEILEKIFNLLSLRDFLKLTELCKQFNEIVGSSLKLMDEICIWYQDGCDYLIALNSSRKYRNLRIYDEEGLESSLEIIFHFSKTLKCVGIEDSDIDYAGFQILLKLVQENLESVLLRRTDFKLNGNSVQSFHLPKLRKLEFNIGDNYGSMLKIFTDAPNLEEFSYHDRLNNEKHGAFFMSRDEIIKFGRNLASIQSLIKLELNYNMSRALLKYKNFANTATFKLEEFNINDANDAVPDLYETKIAFSSLKFFLNKQENLKRLELSGLNITAEEMEFLLSLPLQKLSLGYNNFVFNRSINVENSSIETLVISNYFKNENQRTVVAFGEEKMLCELFKCCVAVKQMIFKYKKVTFEMFFAMTYNMPKFEKLTLESSPIHPMAVPTLKELIFIGNGYSNDLITNIFKFLRVNRQLKKLQMPNYCRNLPNCQDAISNLNLEKLSYI